MEASSKANLNLKVKETAVKDNIKVSHKDKYREAKDNSKASLNHKGNGVCIR